MHSEVTVLQSQWSPCLPTCRCYYHCSSLSVQRIAGTRVLRTRAPLTRVLTVQIQRMVEWRKRAPLTRVLTVTVTWSGRRRLCGPSCAPGWPSSAPPASSASADTRPTPGPSPPPRCRSSGAGEQIFLHVTINIFQVRPVSRCEARVPRQAGP